MQGCVGSQFGTEQCNVQACQSGQRKYSAFNDYNMPRAYQQIQLTPFQQECIDFHNFFRALHNLKVNNISRPISFKPLSFQPLEWRNDITRTAQLWADQLRIRAKKGPGQPTGQRTKHWPHSDSPGPFRAKNVGENIAWDLTENGHPCKESVYRWYAELFYFNPKKATKGKISIYAIFDNTDIMYIIYNISFVGRRGNEPVGHLTQLLWPETTHLGCATVYSAIKQPPNTG